MLEGSSDVPTCGPAPSILSHFSHRTEGVARSAPRKLVGTGWRSRALGWRGQGLTHHPAPGSDARAPVRSKAGVPAWSAPEEGDGNQREKLSVFFQGGRKAQIWNSKRMIQ